MIVSSSALIFSMPAAPCLISVVNLSISITPADTAAYRTRVVIHRPVDPARFNGTVFVEWMNVSGGLDAAPDWTGAHTEMIREGAAWVGLSAQKIGIELVHVGLPGVDLPTLPPQIP